MKLFKNQIFRLSSRQEGFNDVVTVTILGGIIGALFILGVFVWQEIDKQNTLNDLYNKLSSVVKVEEEEVEVEEEWLTYNNEKLGFSFKYPKSWGDVSVRYVDDTMTLEEASPLVSSGEGVHIGFGDTYSVNLLLASDDFSQFLMDSYNGDKNLSDGCSNLKNDFDRQYCKILTIAGQNTYGYFSRFNIECSGDGVRYSTFLNLPPNDYVGLRINMFIGESELPIEETEEREDICGRNEDNIEANLQAIYKRDNLRDDLSKKLKDFDIFLESFKFLDNNITTDYCESDDDCVRATCCHPTRVVNKNYAPDCAAVSCTFSCDGPLDCGAGHPACENNKCVIVEGRLE